MKFSIFLLLVSTFLVAKILACCDKSSSSSSSEENCGCKHKKPKKPCPDDEETTRAPSTTTTESGPVITCSKSSIDLVFVVDASGSVGIGNFNKILNALITTVQNVSVGPQADQSHIGLVTFDNIAIKYFGLNDHLSTKAVQEAIAKVPYAGYGTFIELGMTHAIKEVFEKEGNRKNSTDIMIVITDGHDMSNVSGAQKLAASKGITVFSVGIGTDVYYTQLLAISGSHARTFKTTTFDFLADSLKEICSHLSAGTQQKPASDESVVVFEEPELPVSDELPIVPHGSCDYEQNLQKFSDVTREEFCRIRPNCVKIC